MTNNEKYESIAKLIFNWCDGLRIPYMPMDITEATDFVQRQFPDVKYSSGIVLPDGNKLGHGDVLFLFNSNKVFQGIKLSHVSSNRLSIIKNDGMFYGVSYKSISRVEFESNSVYISF